MIVYAIMITELFRLPALTSLHAIIKLPPWQKAESLKWPYQQPPLSSRRGGSMHRSRLTIKDEFKG